MPMKYSELDMYHLCVQEGNMLYHRSIPDRLPHYMTDCIKSDNYVIRHDASNRFYFMAILFYNAGIGLKPLGFNTVTKCVFLERPERITRPSISRHEEMVLIAKCLRENNLEFGAMTYDMFFENQDDGKLYLIPAYEFSRALNWEVSPTFENSLLSRQSYCDEDCLLLSSLFKYGIHSNMKSIYFGINNDYDLPFVTDKHTDNCIDLSDRPYLYYHLSYLLGRVVFPKYIRIDNIPDRLTFQNVLSCKIISSSDPFDGADKLIHTLAGRYYKDMKDELIMVYANESNNLIVGYPKTIKYIPFLHMSYESALYCIDTTKRFIVV